ncbi:kinetochore-associated protein KNL-2 homolog isoform X2 [Aristolochia californica]|uniref:kinetochore-associated protein KNL-2 homolog isoform X2 n=1 Tax=Aristolochia californica TaxID=171875 RepID=UPI0035DA3363
MGKNHSKMGEVSQNKEQDSWATPLGKTPLSCSTCLSLPKKVVLYDWWLIKAETGDGSEKLGVGGMAWTGQKASRVFCSSAIVKRHDSWNLETADGIMVKIEGLINRLHTYQNGFSKEVCSIFMMGFPFDWDIHTIDHLKEGVAGRSPTRVTSFDESSKTPIAFASSVASINNLVKYVQNFGDNGLENEGSKNQNASFSCSSMEEKASVRSETNVSCEKEGHRFVASDAWNCSSSTFTERERRNLIEVKRGEGVHPECLSESRNEAIKSSSDIKSRLRCRKKSRSVGRKVNPSQGEVICKESQTSTTQSLTNSKEESREPFCEDGNKVLKRSSCAGKSWADQKAEPCYNGKNVIASEGEKDDLKVGANTSQTRGSSSRLQNLKDKGKKNQTTADSLKEVKSEITTTAISPNIQSPIRHTHVVKVKQENNNTKFGKKKSMKSGSTPEVFRTPTTSGREVHSSFSPTESLNWRRSRSGRLLVPRQAIWLNQRVVYEQDGRIVGAETGHLASPSGIGPASPRRKRGRPKMKAFQNDCAY